MICEIVNPHDKATFEAPDDEVAVLAMIALGEGAYGATECGTERDVCGLGLFGMFPKNDAGVTLENLKERFEARRADVATALESVLYISGKDRAALIAAGGDPQKFNEEKRGSMSDMSGRAFALAKALRAQLAAAAPV